MAVKGELLVWNHEGTQLEGPRENGSSLVFEYDHQVYLPYDREENRIQGSRRISAFTITKDVDRLTPQLYEMVCLGRTCQKVQITLYRIAPESGDEEEYFHYILEDAKIVSVENLMPSTKIESNENIGHLEQVKFLAKKLTWEYLDGGITYTEESF
ncbi:MAG: type VI secretion system tube protein Hcp [Calditrichaeota bacterium]|nr:MAG: type VI secretion system tube protein Hcp [Calditrichota bacterium]